MPTRLRVGIAVSAACACLAAAGTAGDAPRRAEPQTEDHLAAISELIEHVEHGVAESSDLLRLAWRLERQGRDDLARLFEQSAYETDPSLAPNPDAQVQPTPRGAIGPDVIVCSLAPPRQWTSPSLGGPGPIENGGIRVYSIGTTSKNVGDVTLTWLEGTKLKPLISQSVYRLIDGRIEQIDFSWLKHGFCAINTINCGSCEGPGGCIDELLPACSDPYSSTTNGTFRYLGPHAEVNPVTGDHLTDHASPGTSIDSGRIRVPVDVLTSASSNPDIRLFLEGAYVHMEDAAAGNALNNATYTEAIVIGPDQDLAPNFIPNNPRIGLPAVYAVQEFDPSAMVVAVDVPADGRFHVASNAVRTDSGAWRYEYAVHNLNSDRAGHAFRVPTCAASTPTNPGFKDIEYRDGNGVGGVNYDGADWSHAISAELIEWVAPETFAENPNANALRFGTTYNFWFETDAPPTQRQAALALFKPADPSEIAVPVLAPQQIPGDLNADGEVGAQDLATLLGVWGAEDETADLNADGVINAADLAALLGNWSP